MSRFINVLKELRELQSRLQQTVNRLWSIKLALATAYHHGHENNDFLPRRLGDREHQEQLKFEKLLHQINRIISSHFDSSLIVFNSHEDIKTMASISRTIRYIHNSFNGEPPLGRTWAKINATLPAYSKN